MNYNNSFKSGRATVTTGQVQAASLKIEKREKGLTSLVKGQQISGVVVSIKDRITLSFGGQEVTALKEVLKNATIGDVKLFEVMNASDKEIELKLVDMISGKRQQAFVAAIRFDTDQEKIKEQKEHSDKKAEKEKKQQDTKSKMEDITLRLTEKDYKNLEGEDFPLENYSIKSLHSALNRIKTSNTSTEKNNKVHPQGVFSEENISKRLKEENLPATTDNLQKVMTALELSDITPRMNNRTMKTLIANGKEPTIENIYKAYFSANTHKQETAQAISIEAWRELQPQIEEVIGAAGFEVNDENLEQAKWLIENRLPLTKETFAYKKELEEVRVHINKDIVLDQIVEGMKNGTAPKDISMQPDKKEGYKQLITDIHSIREETVVQAVKENVDLSIRELIKSQANLPDENNTEAANPNSFEEIKALRQLEEIRLKMTMEAAARLDKMGFHIETERLEKVVEELKALEDNYYKELLSEAEVKASEQHIQILKETTQSIEHLKYIPNTVLGRTLSEHKSQTIPNLRMEGSRLQKEMAKAGEAYETLMTVPNREYGDSIHKAFKNMEPMLKEMNIDNTEANQRAVRILGYNRMEITKESINQVKAYDLEVNSLIQNLNPAVTVRLIKEGINPLNMTISELNQTIDRIKEEQGISTEDKFSTYLRKLEKEEAITEVERKAYIGIYRLFHNIEKMDGAALGAVLKANEEVTLNHLLTAVRTHNKGSIDTLVNDELGILQSVSFDKETISEQLSAVFTDETSRQSITDQTEYMSRMLKLIKEELAPEKLSEVQLELQKTGLQEGQLAAELAPMLSSKKGIWETIANISVEKFYGRLQNAEGVQQAEKQMFEEKVQEIREIYKNSEQAIRFLEDFKMPCTTANVMMANHILSNGESKIKKLLNRLKENEAENSESSLKETTELTDTLIDKTTMNEAYEKMEKEAKAALDRACSEERIDARRLAELKSIGAQMTFLKTLAKEEFYRIPIETESGVTNINLTIIRGAEAFGKVSVMLRSERLGNVKAEISLRDQSLKGFVGCDSREGLDILQENVRVIEEAAAENELTLKQLDFGMQSKGYESYTYQHPENEDLEHSMGPVTEKKLYRMAKAIVFMVRAAEQAASDGNRVAS